mgnify:CR=1 FL=1
MPQIGNKKYSYDAAGMAAYNRDKRRMQGGGAPRPPQTMVPPQQVVPQTQRPPQQMIPQTQRPPQQGQPQSVSPMERALGHLLEENERMKQQLQMASLQMQKMEMIQSGKTPPSTPQQLSGRPTPKKRGGIVKKRKGGACGPLKRSKRR